MINVTHSIILVLVAAVVTLMLRAFPFVVFGGKSDMPKFVKRIADILPAAIMSVLVVYCIKGDVTGLQSFVMSGNTESLVSAFATVIALCGVVLIHLKKRQTLLSIATGTVIYMALIRLIPLVL